MLKGILGPQPSWPNTTRATPVHTREPESWAHVLAASCGCSRGKPSFENVSLLQKDPGIPPPHECSNGELGEGICWPAKLSLQAQGLGQPRSHILYPQRDPPSNWPPCSHHSAGLLPRVGVNLRAALVLHREGTNPCSSLRPMLFHQTPVSLLTGSLQRPGEAAEKRSNTREHILICVWPSREGRNKRPLCWSSP